MSEWQIYLLGQAVQTMLRVAPDPRELADNLIDMAQAKIKETPNKFDDALLPILNELEEAFGDPSD
jgi:hypothetical protein